MTERAACGCGVAALACPARARASLSRGEYKPAWPLAEDFSSMCCGKRSLTKSPHNAEGRLSTIFHAAAKCLQDDVAFFFGERPLLHQVHNQPAESFAVHVSFSVRHQKLCGR